MHVKIGTAQIENTQNEKLLGITIDSKLSFDKHIQQICSRASAKLKALARIAPFMNITKRKILMNAFFNAQFSYCPLTWMFHSRKLNNKINKLHERCLRIVYNNNTSTYEELLEADNSVSVHFRNVQALAIELYKVVNGFSPDIMKDVFPLNANSFYKTRNKRTFHSRHIRTVHFGSETLSHLAPKIWELVPEEITKLKIRLKNGNRQIVLAANVEHIYFRLALCNYFIIQSETFFVFSFIYMYGTINICTPASIWCG